MRQIGLILLFVLLPTAAAAQGLGDLAGTIDISHVDADVDGRDDETWRQLYTLNWTRAATDYINLRAGIRYYDFDLESTNEFFGTFQEEIQPSAEVLWSHPWFQFNANANRRIARSPAISGDLITDSVLLNLETVVRETPRFGVRYEMQEVDETGNEAQRGTRSRRLTGFAEQRFERETFDYRIARTWTDNLIRGLESTELEQRFQYLGFYNWGERREFQLTSQYRYSRTDLSSEAESGVRFLERVQPAQGLGGFDSTPDQGPLPIVPGLIDGNTLAPVNPPIGIGAGEVDWNIGVDLGVRRERVAALYIYTDRLSSETLQWRVWVSDDNLNWDDSVVFATTSVFNASLSRYEIEFNAVEARYVKVVNSGVNSVVGVQVTEVEVFESIQDTDRIERDASSHLADARLIWNVNEKWQLSLDGVARLDPVSGTVGQRLDYSYGARARYQPSYQLAHVLRWGQAWRDFEDDSRDLRDDNSGYSLLYDPLPTLGGSLSGSVRQSVEGGTSVLRSANALLAANAEPYRTVRLGGEFGISRIDQPDIDLMTDSWSTRWSLDTDVTSRLNVSGIWFYQQSRLDSEDRVRDLRRYSVAGELQVTSAIFARAAVDFSEDESFFRRQDYLLSWRLFTQLLLTGQAIIQDGSPTSESERYSVTGNLDLFDRFLIFRNVTVYARFSDVDQRASGGSRILSWQQGLRASF